jgi:phospholipase C
MDNLRHVVVLMLENRSFDHMLGALKAQHPKIDGLTGNEINLDSTGEPVKVSPNAEFRGQLLPDPHHDFASVDMQIFDGAKGPARVATMGGFVHAFHTQQPNVAKSRSIMFHFDVDPPNNLPVLHKLATEFAVFNRWFASIPGPTLCNRAFAHYGSSFGNVGMNLFYEHTRYKSIYQRLLDNGRTAKVYYFDQTSSTLEVVNLLQNQAQLFGTYPDFLAACDADALPDYSFIEPNYKDHMSQDGSGKLLATDQHPDNDVRAGENFIADIYNRIRLNDKLWPKTALLVVYDEHGGIYDHVPPPALDPAHVDPNDRAPATATGTGEPFLFDRLGVRVPAILISPWVEQGSVINETFEHASIPGTITNWLLPGFDPAQRSVREAGANTFLSHLSLDKMRNDCPDFE